ncbi:phosphatidylglycerophosphatase A [Thermodesulfobacteriota bacterium]
MSVSQSDNLTLRESFRKTDLLGKSAFCLSSWFGSGLVPIAPGTFGTLTATPLVVALCYLDSFVAGLLLLFIIILAVWSAGLSERILGRIDPPEVVIDEVAGFAVTVFLLPPSWPVIILGFALFRLFDIFKPFPIGTVEKRVKGGIGIVLDDLLAGIYSNLLIRLMLWLFI